MESYENISGQIDMNVHKRIAIQVESINRIKNIEQVQLIMFDEIDSILHHVSQTKNNCNDVKIESLIKLIKQDCTKIYLDGYMNQNTIKLIQSINNVEPFIIHNKNKPRINEKIIINDYNNSKENQIKLIKQIIQHLNEGLKLVISCSSYELSKQIVENINSHCGDNKKVQFYNGHNEEFDEETGLFHIEEKKQHFANTDIWLEQNLDCLIYTGTLVSGVNFDHCHFDKLIGIYNNRCSSPNYFIQSLLRVRKFNCDTQEIYLDCSIGKSNKNITSELVLKCLTSMEERTIHKLFDNTLNIRCVLMNKMSILNKYGIIYIIQALQILGFTIILPEQNNSNISIEDITVNRSNKSIQFEEYFKNNQILDYDYFDNTIKNP